MDGRSVVDDHASVRHMATRLLACLGHQTLQARVALEAEDTFSRHGNEVAVVLLEPLMAR